MSAGDLLDLAWSLVDARRLEEARSAFKEICETDGDDPEPWMMLGALHAEFQDLQNAISCLRKSIELDPVYADAHLNLAKVFFQQNEIDRALLHCSTAVENDPSFPEAWQVLGGIQERLGDFAGAEASSRRAIELVPRNASCHANLALALWKQDKLHESVESYQKALQLDPQLIAAQLQLAAVYSHLNENSEAERCYRKAIEIAPERGDSYGQLGDLLARQGRTDEAIEAFRRALHKQSDDAGVHLQLGWAYQRKKRWDDAIASYREALRLAPENVNACFGIAAAFLEKGSDKTALEYFQRALQLDPHNDEIQFHIAQLTGTSLPNTAPPAYVKRLFDDYADRFDSHLVGDLSYRGPELIRDAVMDAGGGEKRELDILDLGCGTGLCAPLFKGWAARLSGVDLSEKMVESARRRGLYDHLRVGDMSAALEGANEAHDLIIAADVFIYVGELDRVFELCSVALKRRGLFAFTVEAAADESADFVLEPSGRYSHTKRYLTKLAQSFGLEVSVIRAGVLRTDRGRPINGYTVVMRRR